MKFQFNAVTGKAEMKPDKKTYNESQISDMLDAAETKTAYIMAVIAHWNEALVIAQANEANLSDMQIKIKDKKAK